MKMQLPLGARRVPVAIKRKLIETASLFDFPIHKPYFELTEGIQKTVVEGNKHFKGN
ncbi:MAG: hypothetical protein CM15mP83_9270 [Flavobacteriaceae bacterium]|nr:MAG: hypothetical protein CM15mP83_9270 [Flavobacteriaceae bacterium]